MFRLLIAALLAALASEAVADWPQFRGPSGDGIANARGLPTQWSDTQNVLWKTLTPGHGRSSPVVCDGRIWLTAAQAIPAPPEEAVERLADHPDASQVHLARFVSFRIQCYDLNSGKLLYQEELFQTRRPEPVHRMNSFATPTSVVEAGLVYCDFGTYGTACVDATTGKTLWRRVLPIEHMLGPGSSPIVVGNLLILTRDGCDQQYVAALDKRTGGTIWKTDRPPLETESRYEKKSFSTPLAFEFNAREQIVVPGSHWVCSYDPATGKELWRVRHGRNFSVAPRPVFGHGMVFLSTGCWTPELMAIRPDGEGDATETHIAWRAKGSIPMVSSPILAGDELYCVSDDGIASCFDARTGKLLARTRLGGEHLASPIFADGKLFFFRADGKTIVLAPGKDFRRLAENSLEGTLAATPAIIDNRIILRTDTHLICIGQPGE